MSATDVAALIALCAALASAIGDVIRQRSAQEVTDKDVGHLELFWLSVRDPRWWMGGLGAVANYSLQAAALSLGSVLLVTALQVTSLLFALPIYARLAHHRVTRWEWTWAVLLAGSLAVLVTVGDPAAGNARGSLGSWLVVAAVMGPVLVFCVVGARVWNRSAVRAHPVGGGGRLIAGAVRRLDQRCRRRGIGRLRRLFAGAGSLLPDSGRAGGNDLPAVGISRRCADCVVADGDRRQAGGRRCGCSGAPRDAEHQRTTAVDSVGRLGAGGDFHHRAGPRRGGDHGEGRAARTWLRVRKSR